MPATTGMGGLRTEIVYCKSKESGHNAGIEWIKNQNVSKYARNSGVWGRLGGHREEGLLYGGRDLFETWGRPSQTKLYFHK